MSKHRTWNAYIMAGNIKIYLRKNMTTTEAVKWLKTKCKHTNGKDFMCGHKVLCERK